MRRKSHKAFLFLFAFVLLLMSISNPSAEKMRGTTMAVISPFLEYLATSQPVITQSTNSGEQIQRLQLEKSQLTSEVTRLKNMLIKERRLMAQLKTSQLEISESDELTQLARKRYQELKVLLKFQLQAIPAKVLFRSPSSWGSSLWLDVGHANNEAMGCEIIAKNSPVVVGDSIVGVVDYVGTHQCRIRLVTDSGLSLSVRAVRGNIDPDEPVSAQEGIYLAKGELHGSSKPLWRSRGILLHGVGFNYDFGDSEGPARDLRTGIPVGSSDSKAAIALIKINDFLVTTGMDGIFPPGFYVGQVTHVNTLREGDYYYDLQAKPTAGNLDELTFVHVLPPMGYDPDDQPPLLGE